jgi:hypothetical protein
MPIAWWILKATNAHPEFVIIIGFSVQQWLQTAPECYIYTHTYIACPFFHILLTVHLSIIFANVQLDTQILCFIISLLQSSTCLEQRRAHYQEVKFY